jgi:hypothetical protein
MDGKAYLQHKVLCPQGFPTPSYWLERHARAQCKYEGVRNQRNGQGMGKGRTEKSIKEEKGARVGVDGFFFFLDQGSLLFEPIVVSVGYLKLAFRLPVPFGSLLGPYVFTFRINDTIGIILLDEL